jgi:beta-galactosidase/beta-glucuronidase
LGGLTRRQAFAVYRKYFFRYASEFGFQSFLGLKTVEIFTLPEDRNIFSRVMEMHQRNDGANGKIINYHLSQTFLCPGSFDTLLYASQLLQAEEIRCGVEHWRSNCGRCIGAVYWQLNDIWPAASWASIDYYGRWKALHCYAKLFFAPVMISCCETGETTDRVSVQLVSKVVVKKIGSVKIQMSSQRLDKAGTQTAISPVCGTSDAALRRNHRTVARISDLVSFATLRRALVSMQEGSRSWRSPIISSK